MPICPTTSSAATINNTVSANATLNIKSTVAVSLTTNLLQLELSPAAEGSFSTATADLKVATNNITGYSVYLTANNDGKLVASDKSNPATINPVVGTMNATNYQDHLNSWGYADITGSTDGGQNSNFEAIPSTNTDAIFSSTEEASEDHYRLGIATAVGIDLPSGVYQGAITVSVVANPKEVTNLTELTYMQDMTSAICQNTMDYVDQNTYATKQLIDTRDGKSYWVAKLADGNCWMVQNLALDITEAGLKAADTDLISDWNQGATYKPVKTFSKVGTVSANRTTYSWNLGQYVLSQPASGENCGLTTDINTCSTVGLIDVNDTNKWKPTFESRIESQDNISQVTAARYRDADHPENGGEYDPHYLIGNYYQYPTATAGTGVGLKGNASSSICPKNWRLPRLSETLQNNDFYKLFTAHGINPTYTGGNVETPYSNVGDALIKKPFYFTTAGGIDDRISEVGFSTNIESMTSSGFDYSETGYSTRFVIHINERIAIYNGTLYRNGYSVRCLAR